MASLRSGFSIKRVIRSRRAFITGRDVEGAPRIVSEFVD